MSPIHVVASTNMDPLQDPHLRIHVSISLWLRLLCTIHVSGFMSQHPCVSQDPLQDPCCRIHSSAAICIAGSSARSTSWASCRSIFVSHGFSARSTSPDTCLSIHLYLRILCKIHVSGSMCPIHVLASTNMDPLQDPCLRIHVPTSLYLRLLCKIHVSGSVYKHPYVSQDPLQDPCLRVEVSVSKCISGTSARSMSPDPYISIHMYLRILCKIHVSGFMSQHLYISGSSARSMSPDPYISIQMYLRVLCKIHVSGSIYQHPYVSQDPLQDPCVRFQS